jgi:hypothetical protein
VLYQFHEIPLESDGYSTPKKGHRVKKFEVFRWNYTNPNETLQNVLQTFFPSHLHPQLFRRALRALIRGINGNGY